MKVRMLQINIHLIDNNCNYLVQANHYCNRSASSNYNCNYCRYSNYLTNCNWVAVAINCNIISSKPDSTNSFYTLTAYTQQVPPQHHLACLLKSIVGARILSLGQATIEETLLLSAIEPRSTYKDVSSMCRTCSKLKIHSKRWRPD